MKFFLPFGPFFGLALAWGAGKVAGVSDKRRHRWMAIGVLLGMGASAVNWVQLPPPRLVPWGPVQGIMTTWAVAVLAGATPKMKQRAIAGGAVTGVAAAAFNFNRAVRLSGALT